MRHALIVLALLCAAPLQAEPAPGTGAEARTGTEAVTAILAAAPQGTRFGLLVLDEEGREVIEINPDQRFIPGSNAKLFTTAAAFDLASRDPTAALAGGAVLNLALRQDGHADALLVGGGVSLSSAADCKVRCLADLAAQLAGRTRKVRDVVADDSAFADRRWSPGMSWNNIGTRSGTATSALIVDDNEAVATITPGAPGSPPQVGLTKWFLLDNQARTVAAGETRLEWERQPLSRTIRLRGTIRADAPVQRERIGIDEPAHFAAWMLKQALEARGVKVRGNLRVIEQGAAAPPAAYRSLQAFAVPAVPLEEAAARINKDSQNLHAEALLVRLGAASPQPGTRAAGLAALGAVMDRAGIPPAGYELHDGSGMSSYNRASPRAAAALLRWTAGQPWGRQFKASLAVAGQDGTLRRRFTGTALESKLFAKTGSLNASTALSGWLTAASGKVLTFAFFANDFPAQTSVTALMDQALLALAEGN